MSDSPAALLIDENGVFLAVSDGVAIPVGTKGVFIVGSDGTNAKFIRMASDGTIRVDPTGTTTQPVSVASLPLPSGAATEATLSAINVKIPASPSQEHVTAGSPHSVRLSDGTSFYKATTPSDTQPISAASLPLPTGAATEATLATLLTTSAFQARINTLGQKAMAASTPVVLSSDQSAIPITDNGGSLTVDGTVTSNQGTAAALAGAWPVQVTDGTNTMPTMDTAGRSGWQRLTDGTNGPVAVKPASTAPAATDKALVVVLSPNDATLASRLADATFTARVNVLGQNTMANSTPVVLASNQSAIPITDNSGSLTVDTTQLPAALVGGRLDVNTGAWLGSTAPTVGQKTMANSIPVVISSDQSEVQVKQGTAAALSGYWPVRNTDGTNQMPTLDAASRAGYMRLTDGTSTIGTLFKTLYSDPNGDRRTIHSGATITSSGSTVLTWIGHSEWYLLINITGPVTGTSPTIQFKLEEVDPIDQTTTGFTEGGARLGAVLTAVGVDVIEVPELVSDTVKISWTVTGTSPSFGGVNVTFCGHGAGNAIEGQAPEGTPLHDAPVPVAGVDNSNLIHTLKVDSSGSLQVVVSNIVSGARTGVKGSYVSFGGGTANTLQALRATTYTEPASAAQRSVGSSSASDTSAGVGARTVIITYYDGSGLGPFTETVTLNGTTAVNTVATNIRFIERMDVMTAGSSGTNVGTITLFGSTGGGGGTVGTIGVGNIITSTGDGRTFWAHHYVTTGYTASLSTFSMAIQSGGASTSGRFFLRVAYPLTANTAENVLGDVILVTGSFLRQFTYPAETAGFARLTAYVIPAVNNATASASFDFSEVPS